MIKYLISIVFLFSFFNKVHAQTVTWEKQFHFGYYNSIGAAIETEDSGFFVAAGIGDTLSSGLWLMKLDKRGEVEWKKMIDQNGGDIPSLTYFIRKQTGVYILLE